MVDHNDADLDRRVGAADHVAIGHEPVPPAIGASTTVPLRQRISHAALVGSTAIPAAPDTPASRSYASHNRRTRRPPPPTRTNVRSSAPVGTVM